ncbi:hypothetical protein VTK26DRAFT_8268 [Humicola hyalothermophila]
MIPFFFLFSLSWSVPHSGVTSLDAGAAHVMEEAALQADRRAIPKTSSRAQARLAHPAPNNAEPMAEGGTAETGVFASPYAKFLKKYLGERNEEYDILYKRWLSGETCHQYPPASWPADRCLLTRLPAELLVMVCQYLYQADLFHLALTCHALHAYPIGLLYTRDVAHFDSLGLRWACTFGVVPTLKRALSYGAKATYVFACGSHIHCDWVLGGDSNAGLCDTPLRTAVVAGEPEIIRLLLAHGADVNEPDHRSGCDDYIRLTELRPIHLAFGFPGMRVFERFRPGNPLLVRCLLDAGANPNERTRRGRVNPASIRHGNPGRIPPRDVVAVRGTPSSNMTPLLLAMQAEVPAETVELLLQRGADPIRRGRYIGFFQLDAISGKPGAYFWDCSPLGAVLSCSTIGDTWPFDLDKIRLLLWYGGVKEFRPALTSQSNGPVIPVLYRHWDHVHIANVLEVFIDAGADVASWAAMIIPPILCVIHWAESFMPKVWLNNDIKQFSDTIAKIRRIITLLAEATLVRQDSANNNAGNSNPHDSSRLRKTRRRSSIIDHAISSTAQDVPPRMREQSPLRYIAMPFRFPGATAALAPLLLRYGADVNAADSLGRTALHHAAVFTSGERIRALIAAAQEAEVSVDVDARDRSGWTPLHHACLWGFWGERGGQAATARWLIDQCGADVRARTAGGWTPLGLAALAGNADLVEALIERGAGKEDLFLKAEGTVNLMETEMETVQVGRFVLLWMVDADHDMEARVAAELAVERQKIAGLLASRLGLAVPGSRWDSGDPGVVYPQGYMLWNADDVGKLPRLRVDVINQPFGVSFTELAELTAQNFQNGVHVALQTLDAHGLSAWIASIRDERHDLLGCLSRRSWRMAIGGYRSAARFLASTPPFD